MPKKLYGADDDKDYQNQLARELVLKVVASIRDL